MILQRLFAIESDWKPWNSFYEEELTPIHKEAHKRFRKHIEDTLELYEEDVKKGKYDKHLDEWGQFSNDLHRQLWGRDLPTEKIRQKNIEAGRQAAKDAIKEDLSSRYNKCWDIKSAQIHRKYARTPEQKAKIHGYVAMKKTDAFLRKNKKPLLIGAGVLSATGAAALINKSRNNKKKK